MAIIVRNNESQAELSVWLSSVLKKSINFLKVSSEELKVLLKDLVVNLYCVVNGGVMKRINLMGLMVLSAAVLMFLTSTVMAAGPSKVKIMADACLTCHGPNGVGSGKIPELKGLEKSDITESLYGFKSGDEKSTIMGRHAKALSDSEIEMLAEYFAEMNK